MDTIKNIVNKNQTIKSASGLEILSVVFILLQRLQIILAITKEQVISKKKSFKLQNIIKLNPNIDSLKSKGLFNSYNNYLFSEYPKPFAFA